MTRGYFTLPSQLHAEVPVQDCSPYGMHVAAAASGPLTELKSP
jgi:hypothetical protein